MKRILAQCRKELSQFQRDRLTLALAFLLPFMTLIIFGFAIRLETKNIPLFIQDFDISPLSRAYTEKLFATNQFEPIHQGNIPDIELRPQSVIDRGIAKASVIIPPDFSKRIKSGLTSQIQVLIDGTDVNNARIIKNSIQATTKFFLIHSGLELSPDKVVAHIRLWFNPGRKESLAIIPGIYGLVLWIYPSLLTAIAMVREKEKGTILQVYTSNLSCEEFLLGKALGYLVIGMMEAILVMVTGSLIWQLKFAGDPTPLFIGTVLFLIDSIMFGLLIGVRSENQNSAVQMVSLLGFVSALLLSGFIYPLTNIPFPLSLISVIIPTRYYIEIARDAYVRGTGWTGIWFAMFMLFFLGSILFNAARKNLQKMQLSD